MFGWRLLNRTPKPCKVRSCRTLIPFPHKYRKQRCPFRFLHQRMAVCCICSGSCCNPAKFENRRNAPPVSVRCTLLIRQRTPCSESRAFGWQLPSRTPKPCKVRSCRTLIPSPHKYRKQRCLFRFLHRRMVVCCICSGSCCNPAKFEKQKKCTVYFSTVHVACQSENALQREPSVRVAITEQNAEALQGSLLQNTDTIPTQIQETTLPIPVFAP